MLRDTARSAIHLAAQTLTIFPVLHFGARGCEVACRDFKSSASAIPPPGQLEKK
jgi:hypothetical protein